MKVSDKLVHYSKYNYPDIITKLIRKGADVNYVNRNDYKYYKIAPLRIASEHGCHETVKVLLKAGAWVNRIDTYYNSPIMYASRGGHTETVKVLLEAGENVNCVNKKGNTPLTLASKYNHFETVKVLLEAGANANHMNNNRDVSLKFASSNHNIDMIRELINAGADIPTETTIEKFLRKMLNKKTIMEQYKDDIIMRKMIIQRLVKDRDSANIIESFL